MAREKHLKTLPKHMKPVLNTGTSVFCVVKDIDLVKREGVLFEFKEKEGVTLVLEQAKADAYRLTYQGTFSWFTLTVHSSLEAVGLTAAFSNALAQENISCNVVAAYYHDPIFVPVHATSKALEALQKLSQMP